MSTPAVTPDKPLEFTLGDGSVVRAATMEEAFKQVEKMRVDASLYAKEQKAKADAVEAERQRLEAELNRRSQPVSTSGGAQFDKQHYYEMLNSDPLAAQDYVDAFRFGLPQQQVRSTFIQMNQDVSVMRQNMIANQFTQQHMEDFPMGDATAARAMTKRVEELVTGGYPFDVRTMNLAYSELVNEGTIKPNVKTEDEPTPAPPPSLSGAGGQVLTQSEVQRIESMDDKQLEAFLRANGKLG